MTRNEAFELVSSPCRNELILELNYEALESFKSKDISFDCTNLMRNPYNQVDKAGAQELRNKCEDIHNGECLNWNLIYCPAGWETGLCPGANNIKVIFR